jgi:hypothetical protein
MSFSVVVDDIGVVFIRLARRVKPDALTVLAIVDGIDFGGLVVVDVLEDIVANI